jgi:hypothetical protein
MAEWFKASRLKRDSPATRRGGGRSVATEHKGTWVRRPEGGGAHGVSEHILLVRRRRKRVCAKDQRTAEYSYCKDYGGMAEWFKAAVLKTASPKGDVGSNPTPSAMHHVGCMAALNST